MSVYFETVLVQKNKGSSKFDSEMPENFCRVIDRHRLDNVRGLDVYSVYNNLGRKTDVFFRNGDDEDDPVVTEGDWGDPLKTVTPSALSEGLRNLLDNCDDGYYRAMYVEEINPCVEWLQKLPPLDETTCLLFYPN